MVGMTGFRVSGGSLQAIFLVSASVDQLMRISQACL